MSKKIIAFAGRKQSGKTMLAKHIAEKNDGVVIPIANVLKHLCADLIKVDINTIESWKNDKDMVLSKMVECGGFDTIENWIEYAGSKLKQSIFKDTVVSLPDNNHIINDILNKKLNKNSTVRDLYQIIGTDIIRYLSPNWHILKTIEAIESCDKNIIIIDDVRFLNEKKAIEDMGGNCYFIIRPDLSIDISNHISETSLKWTDFKDTNIIFNMFNKEYLINEIQDNIINNPIKIIDSPVFAHNNYYFEDVNKNFGLEMTKIVSDILPIMRDMNGSIILNLTNKDDVDLYCKTLYTKKVNTQKNEYMFINIWNPYIIENIKMWL